ncbi:hypothetical protein SCHPADRAFT_823743, partial [Schizopora paradoxa]
LMSSSSSALKKGKACICCRRRKLKCDGVRPICSQCIDSGREMDCEYTDSFNSTRTELLEDYLAQLQQRARELEAGRSSRGHTNPNVQPYGACASVNMESAPVSWWDYEPLPPNISKYLQDKFFERSSQLSFSLDVPRMKAALALKPSDDKYPHEGLIYAIYLWGARLSGNRDVAKPQAERAFFERATQALQIQLDTQSATRHLQAVQTQILLALYAYACGRPIETDYHVTAAISLILSSGMHVVSPGQNNGDNVDEGERIMLFWQVFILDHCWAVASRKPARLRVDEKSDMMITTPWPLWAHEYVAGSSAFQAANHSQPVRQFIMERGNSTSGYSALALAAKASAVYELASRLASSRPSANVNEQLQETIRLADETIVTFISTLASLDVEAPQDRKCHFVMLHCIAYSSLIVLHETVSSSDASAYGRCLHAARLISATLGYLKADEVASLPAFVIPSCTLACKVLLSETRRVRDTPPGREVSVPSDVIEAESTRIMQTLVQLRSTYPVVGEYSISSNRARR